MDFIHSLESAKGFVEGEIGQAIVSDVYQTMDGKEKETLACLLFPLADKSISGMSIPCSLQCYVRRTGKRTGKREKMKSATLLF